MKLRKTVLVFCYCTQITKLLELHTITQSNKHSMKAKNKLCNYKRYLILTNIHGNEKNPRREILLYLQLSQRQQKYVNDGRFVFLDINYKHVIKNRKKK